MQVSDGDLIYSDNPHNSTKAFVSTANPTLADLVDPGLAWALAALAALSIAGGLIARRRRMAMAR